MTCIAFLKFRSPQANFNCCQVWIADPSLYIVHKLVYSCPATPGHDGVVTYTKSQWGLEVDVVSARAIWQTYSEK